jgi:hypothetical protein
MMHVEFGSIEFGVRNASMELIELLFLAFCTLTMPHVEANPSETLEHEQIETLEYVVYVGNVKDVEEGNEEIMEDEYQPGLIKNSGITQSN